MDALDVINVARDRCTLEALSSLDDTGDPTLNRSKRLFENSRKRIAQDHYWNCLARRAVLSPDDKQPLFDYKNQFTLPNDCLLLTGIWGTRSRFKVEGRKILSDIDDKLYIIYNADIEDLNVYDQYLVNVIALHLAAEFAFAVKQDTALKRILREEYLYELSQARYTDNRTEGDGMLQVDTWLAARYYWNGSLYDVGDIDFTNHVLLYRYFGDSF